MMGGLKENLLAALRSRGLSIAQLARKSGIPKATLHAWTTGREPKISQLRKVAEALKMPLYKLAFSEPDPFEEKDVPSELLQRLFSGDLRVTIDRIERIKKE